MLPSVKTQKPISGFQNAQGAKAPVDAPRLRRAARTQILNPAQNHPLQRRNAIVGNGFAEYFGNSQEGKRG